MQQWAKLFVLVFNVIRAWSKAFSCTATLRHRWTRVFRTVAEPENLCKQELLSLWGMDGYAFSVWLLQQHQNLWGHHQGACQAAQSLLQLKYLSVPISYCLLRSSGKQFCDHSEIKIFMMSNAATNWFQHILIKFNIQKFVSNIFLHVIQLIKDYPLKCINIDLISFLIFSCMHLEKCFFFSLT